MLELKSFFLAYIRSRSRFFTFILLLTGLIFLFDVLFVSQVPYFNYFFFLSTFLTFLFLVFDFLIELQRYRKERNQMLKTAIMIWWTTIHFGFIRSKHQLQLVNF